MGEINPNLARWLTGQPPQSPETGMITFPHTALSDEELRRLAKLIADELERRKAA